MSRNAVAMCGAIAVAWFALGVMGIDPPMMQTYSLALGWQSKVQIASHAVRYLACLLAMPHGS